MPAFEASVKEAGVGALMTAYNRVNGVYCSEHFYLLSEVLKGYWQFDGLVMSDWVSTYSAEGAANAGLDLEMPTAVWLKAEHLLPLLATGRIRVGTIDDKVRRLLRLAVSFGWLDRPQLDTSVPEDDPQSRQVALEVARAGIVLLKNDHLLPFDATKLKTLAVLGPYAHPAIIGGGGSAYTTPFDSTSVLDGLRRQLGETVRIVHAIGPDPNPQRIVFSNSDFGSDLGPGLRAEYFNNEDLSGDPVVVRLDERLDFRWGAAAPMPEITIEHFSAHWRGWFEAKSSGRHVVYARSHDSVYRVVLNNKSIIDTWDGERNGLHTVELMLEQGQRYSIEIVWRKTRYWGGMQLGWECIEGRSNQIAECVAVAEAADAAVICVGFDNVSEGEGFDRPFAMPASLEELVVAVGRVQAHTAVVLTAGGNVDMNRWLDSVRGLLYVAYPGQAGGQAIAEILLGSTNPSGKLPVTFERQLEDRSSHDCYHDDDHDQHVRLRDGIYTGYRHTDRSGIAPRFEFGFGLSYTQFRYGSLTFSRSEIVNGESLVVSVEVGNVGDRTGAEVVQVYVRDVESSVPRPRQELKGFTKVELSPGESKRVQIELGPRAFAFYDVTQHDWSIEPGEFEILVGASSRDIRERGIVRVI